MNKIAHRKGAKNAKISFNSIFSVLSVSSAVLNYFIAGYRIYILNLGKGGGAAKF